MYPDFEKPQIESKVNDPVKEAPGGWFMEEGAEDDAKVYFDKKSERIMRKVSATSREPLEHTDQPDLDGKNVFEKFRIEASLLNEDIGEVLPKFILGDNKFVFEREGQKLEISGTLYRWDDGSLINRTMRDMILDPKVSVTQMADTYLRLDDIKKRILSAENPDLFMRMDNLSISLNGVGILPSNMSVFFPNITPADSVLKNDGETFPIPHIDLTKFNPTLPDLLRDNSSAILLNNNISSAFGLVSLLHEAGHHVSHAASSDERLEKKLHTPSGTYLVASLTLQEERDATAYQLKTLNKIARFLPEAFNDAIPRIKKIAHLGLLSYVTKSKYDIKFLKWAEGK